MFVYGFNHEFKAFSDDFTVSGIKLALAPPSWLGVAQWFGVTAFLFCVHSMVRFKLTVFKWLTTTYMCKFSLMMSIVCMFNIIFFNVDKLTKYLALYLCTCDVCLLAKVFQLSNNQMSLFHCCNYCGCG